MVNSGNFQIIDKSGVTALDIPNKFLLSGVKNFYLYAVSFILLRCNVWIISFSQKKIVSALYIISNDDHT